MIPTKRKRLTSAAVIELIGALKDVQDRLPDSYISDDDEGSYEITQAVIQAEDIEIQLAKIVTKASGKCGLRTEPEDLAGLMGALFSFDDDLVSLATNLEDSINGYFGSLFGEDLQMARTYFEDLIAGLEEKVSEWKRKRASQS